MSSFNGRSTDRSIDNESQLAMAAPLHVASDLRGHILLNHHLEDRPIIRYGTAGSLQTPVASRKSPKVTCAEEAVKPCFRTRQTKQRRNGMRLKRRCATRTYVRNDVGSRAGIH